MRAGSRIQRCWFFAFLMPFSRLRHDFVTPSARLRGRSSKALGPSNLRSDSPLDSAHFGPWHLDSIGVLNVSGTFGLLAACVVVCVNAVRGPLLDVASSGQAPVHDPVACCGLERRDNQLRLNAAVHDLLQQLSTNAREDEKSVSERVALLRSNACWSSREEKCVRSERKEFNYVAKSWSNTI